MAREQERRKNRSEKQIEALKKQLQHVAREGGFKAALLATADGELINDIESTYESDKLSDLANTIGQMLPNARDKADLSPIQQITLTDNSGNIMFFRFFNVLEQPVVLIVITRNAITVVELIERAVLGIKRILTQARK
ncbi:hypothetical protein QUF90_21695 [Desulfococcaceae bacterium HSG9]|nr:hypothetical protein [Desulfococcaceae bacterium HSG9]